MGTQDASECKGKTTDKHVCEITENNSSRKF